mgnify:CR=1 FL=1
MVFGTVSFDQQNEQHAWTIYKDERGCWCLLDATLRELPPDLPLADRCASPDVQPVYRPDLCLNRDHVWEIGDRRQIQDVQAYVARRHPVADGVARLRATPEWFQGCFA